jgi:prepilin-type N-terminal cleavage/methylation domain-containing protein
MTQRKQGEGFTLIELLVVVIIIGVLAAIALPSFLNQANKAKQSEAKQYVASINKGQQAYYTERSEFVDKTADLAKLGVGLPAQSKEYTYTLAAVAPQASAAKGDVIASATVGAAPNTAGSPLKAYGGLVAAINIEPVAGQIEVTTYSGVCESTASGGAANGAVDKIDEAGVVTCKAGTPLGGK